MKLQIMAAAVKDLRVMMGWYQTSYGAGPREFRHADGFYAREILTGRENHSIGFLVMDQGGARLGMVAKVEELP